jgi:hypothetical protein
MAATLAGALRDRVDDVVAAWTTRFERSPLRLRRDVPANAYASMMRPLCEALAIAIDTGEAAMRRGSPASREIEKGCGFIGGHLATGGATGFDVAAVILTLRESVMTIAAETDRRALDELFEWLMVIALDAFATAGTRTAEERANEALEIGTPVLRLTHDIPAVILVGEPAPGILDAIFGRVTLTVIGASAKTLIVDVTGLAAPARPALLEAVDRWLSNKRMAAVLLALVGVSGEVRKRWQDIATAREVELTVCDSFETAFALAQRRK